ncbi:hypothetical protein AB1Y20_016886 [Prymnesium parvum]|uniref:Chalcone isomerase domain-containing protein n=1 Tax=Prymnesium parvum TaxID=97485 RepID=A0AB34ICK5_PRYPA
MVPVRLSALVVAAAAGAYFLYTYTTAVSGEATIIDGITFPSEIRASGSVQKLCGGGTRFKYNVAKVYAVALYFEPSAAARGGADSLKPFVGSTAAALGKSNKFYDALIAGKFAKSLLLQFHRSVGSDTITTALKDSLSKKVSSSVLRKFSDALGQALVGGSIPRGGKLSFHCKAESMQIAFGDSSPASSLKEKGLCAAFFSLYYGNAPVSPTAKESAAKAFASLYT